MGHDALQVCRSALRAPDLDAVEDDAVTPVDLSELLASAATLPARSGWVRLDGPRPGLSPHLEAVVAALAARGLRVKLVTGPEGLDEARLAGLIAAGVHGLRLRVHGGTAVDHEAVTGVPGSFEHVCRLATSVQAGTGCRLELDATLTTRLDPAAWVALAAGWGCTVHLRPLRLTRQAPERLKALVLGAGPDEAALLAVLVAADEIGVEVVPHDLQRPPRPAPPPGDPVALSRNLWTWLREGVRLGAFARGCRVTGVEGEDLADLVRRAGSLDDLGLQLAAWGCPALDLPIVAGGAEAADTPWPSAWRASEAATSVPAVCTPAPGDRVAVLNPAIGDKALTLSTLPALVRALRALGADVRWSSVWGPVVPLEVGQHTRRGRQAMDEAIAAEGAMFRELDLSDRDLVIVPGYEAAERVLVHPTLPPHARVVVVDLHLLDGIERWKRRWVLPGRRSMEGGWWPGDRVHVHSCFPGYAHLYRYAGVPLRQVLWRPYPLDTDTFSSGPDPVTCDAIFAGGNQRRRWATLAAAASLLGPGRPVHLWTRDAPPGRLAERLRFQGTTDLTGFHAALASSRFVVLPVAYDRDVASGLTVLAMAAAAGRPVLAACTPGTLDHVRHGVSGWLVPPEDPRALARAIERLDGDEALVTTLAQGARAVSQVASVQSWAHELLHGGPVARAVGPASGPWAPWMPRPIDLQPG